METFYKILDWVNTIFIGITMLLTVIQVVYMILSLFVKKVTFKEAETKHKLCVLIPARNEASVIERLIDNLNEQDYPRDKYDIITIAHNCTDNTAEIARNAGSLVYECKSKERIKGMALKMAIDKYINEDYEFFVVVDADCRVEKDYLTKLNDAFDSGVDVARTYLGSTNTFDNTVSQVSALYNARECRMNARVRERFHMNSQLIGNSFFMSKKSLVDMGGFPSCDSLTEDSDAMVKFMLKGYTIHYVEDAICYTEATNTVKELFKRNMRIGKGVYSDLWHGGYKLIWKSITTFKLTYIDIFFTMAFLPLSVISCLWFPAYYIFLFVKMILTNAPVLHMWQMMDLGTFAIMAVVVLVIMMFMFSLQGLLVVLLQKDRLLKEHKLHEYAKGVISMTPIMLITNVAITCGILNPKQKWTAIKRTGTEDETLMESYDNATEDSTETTNVDMTDDTKSTQVEESSNEVAPVDNAEEVVSSAEVAPADNAKEVVSSTEIASSDNAEEVVSSTEVAPAEETKENKD